MSPASTLCCSHEKCVGRKGLVSVSLSVTLCRIQLWTQDAVGIFLRSIFMRCGPPLPPPSLLLLGCRYPGRISEQPACLCQRDGENLVLHCHSTRCLGIREDQCAELQSVWETLPAPSSAVPAALCCRRTEHGMISRHFSNSHYPGARPMGRLSEQHLAHFQAKNSVFC